MLNNIKTVFSIKDLENFTGIKAHTIRIWEKRYDLLQPCRTDSNIRYYDADNFMRLLNISLLNNNGFKISKLAGLSEDEIVLKAKELSSLKVIEEGAINNFKLAMIKFDTILFNDTFNKLLHRKSFRDIFIDVFIPLLEHIGFLWQTKSIKPIHEHFISNLIIQKIHANIDNNQSTILNKNEHVYVLYLPMGEIHELGLLYIHYELSLRNHRSIYLGQNISLEHVAQLKELYANIHFISYFTVQPVDLNGYLKEAQELLIDNTNNTFWFLGNKVVNLDLKNTQLNSFQSIDEMLKLV